MACTVQADPRAHGQLGPCCPGCESPSPQPPTYSRATWDCPQPSVLAAYGQWPSSAPALPMLACAAPAREEPHPQESAGQGPLPAGTTWGSPPAADEVCPHAWGLWVSRAEDTGLAGPRTGVLLARPRSRDG